MANIFKQVEMTHVKSNTFDLSHEKKMSATLGTLTPTFVMDTIPGDVVSLSSSQLIRFAPMVAPLMHRVKVYMHYFFVPNRILWPNWEKFITGGEDGLDTSVFPTLAYDGTGNKGLPDYLGLPQNQATNPVDTQVSAMPFAAYQKIYNEYYRDQNLQVAQADSLIDGPQGSNEAFELKTLRRRAWQHDYFTSALPWTQKGVEATIPLGTTAPLLTDEPNVVINTQTGAPFNNISILETEATAGNLIGNAAGVLAPGAISADVDLSAASAASINDLRRAFRLQEWLEKNARGGSRYTESILAHFGVVSSDARLQRPEFLGGGSTPVQFSEVLQTTQGLNQATDPTTPQGNMAGHGIAAGANKGFTYKCEEHGYIIGIMSVMPATGYFQGIPKHFIKFDKFDYFWPEFANIGEQPIENRELYFDTENLEQQETFGYTPRYAEYKFMPNTVHGEFRTDLEFWHLARKFANLPTLSSEFIECVPDEARVFAVGSEGTQRLYCTVYNQVKAKRKMPIFGIPTI